MEGQTMTDSACRQTPDDGQDDDFDNIDPVDLSPLVSGQAPIVTAPASEDGEAAGDDVAEVPEDPFNELLKKYPLTGARKLVEALKSLFEDIEALKDQSRSSDVDTQGGASTGQPPAVPDDYTWDLNAAWEREFHLYPEANHEELNFRLKLQVWDMLQQIWGCVHQYTWKKEDQDMANGLINVLILNKRING